MTYTLSSLLLRIIVVCVSASLALCCYAKYTVYRFTPPVKVVRAGAEVPIAKDLELRSNDRITIGEGGELQILNSFDKSISITGKPGTADVLSIILNAANDNPNVIGSPIKPKNNVEHLNTVGGTTRGDFDPFLNNVDCHLLGAAVMNMLEGKSSVACTPVDVKISSADGICEYTIANTTSAPLYFNVIAVYPDSLASSTLGQEIGSYVLNPGQGISRFGIPDNGCRTVMVMSAGYFNVAELLGCIRENEQSPLGRPEAAPAEKLPVFLREIK